MTTKNKNDKNRNDNKNDKDNKEVENYINEDKFISQVIDD